MAFPNGSGSSERLTATSPEQGAVDKRRAVVGDAVSFALNATVRYDDLPAPVAPVVDAADRFARVGMSQVVQPVNQGQMAA